MKQHLLIFTLGFILSSPNAIASDLKDHFTRIPLSGKSILTMTSGDSVIKVSIRTREIDNGTPDNPKEEARKLGCTMSNFPCSIVTSIKIVVNGKVLRLPPSVGDDLADLATGKLRVNANNFVLVLYGGDASESYYVEVEFDASNVVSKTLWDAEFPDEPTQRIIYQASK